MFSHCRFWSNAQLLAKMSSSGKTVKKKNARKIAADYARCECFFFPCVCVEWFLFFFLFLLANLTNVSFDSFNRSLDFDKLPPLTPEYFFSIFEPIMKKLKFTTRSPRFIKDWEEHIKPQQELARKQAREGNLVHQAKQGRPKTVMPLWEEVKIPLELLQRKELLVTLAGNDVPPHMFPKKRKTEYPDSHGYYDAYYFNPFMVIAGPQMRLTIIDAYGFDQVEIEVLEQLTTQYDKKLETENKENARRTASSHAPPSSPGICIPCDSSSSDSSDDDEREQKRRRRHQEEKKAKRNKPVEGEVSTCAAMGIIFDDIPEEAKHAFSHVQTFIRDKELFAYIVTCLEQKEPVVSASSVF